MFPSSVLFLLPLLSGKINECDQDSLWGTGSPYEDKDEDGSSFFSRALGEGTNVVEHL